VAVVSFFEALFSWAPAAAGGGVTVLLFLGLRLPKVPRQIFPRLDL
jgi:hypothetical protein